jgi:hypothetical protein
LATLDDIQISLNISSVGLFSKGHDKSNGFPFVIEEIL